MPKLLEDVKEESGQDPVVKKGTTDLIIRSHLRRTTFLLMADWLTLQKKQEKPLFVLDRNPYSI